MSTISRNDPCWCGSGIKYKKCHERQDDQIRQYARQGAVIPHRSLLKTPEQIEGIRESSKVNIAVLDAVSEKICEGMSTEQIDGLVSEITRQMGGIAAPLNYNGFPKSVCTSVNDQVCHGIPSKDVILKSGDIINVDVSTLYNGYFSDSSRMYCIGDVTEEDRRLVQVAKDSLSIGLAAAKPWGYLGDIGDVINRYVTEKNYTVVREIGGHGIGLEFHEDPWVSYVSEAETGILLVPGLTFTIEPMINAGSADIYTDETDGWTVYTKDGLKSAQWEITITITNTGYEVLTW